MIDITYNDLMIVIVVIVATCLLTYSVERWGSMVLLRLRKWFRETYIDN